MKKSKSKTTKPVLEINKTKKRKKPLNMFGFLKGKIFYKGKEDVFNLA
ncbi:MAG: hypothetical protein PHV07_02915 [Oscillospiraceae bacterium]|nr:hypothetical protein [Oscillospiraceae bacterium]